MVTTIGQRYVVKDKIGQGGMGVVYRVYDRLTGQEVALKQVMLSTDQLHFSAKGTHQDERLALADEFRTLASLRHPHIVSVLDYGFDENRQPFYTMTLIQGGKTLLKAARDLPNDAKLMLIRQILQALAYLHRRGVIHRDLKPGNIMVVDGEIRVLDFGLAVVRSDTTAHVPELAGTLTYMAPELLDGGAASEASDLWAVGIILYEMLAGKAPFDSENLVKLIMEIMQHDPDYTRLGIPPSIQAILDRLLAKKLQVRYGRVNDALRDLNMALGIEVAENSLIRESYLQAAKFVGREREMQILQLALDKAVQRQGSVWLVGGESGVGKTRLLNEVRSYALVRGVLVVRGNGVVNGGLSFQLWRDVLPHLILGIDLTDFEAGILKNLVPNLNELLERDIPDAGELTGKDEQQRLVVTIQSILQRQPQPTLLIFEDLQWALESLLPLRYIMTLVNQLPLLIIGTYRNDERPDLPYELPAAYGMTLNRLSDEAIAQLSQSMLGEIGLQPEVLHIMTRETEGNTFFMVEVARVLLEEFSNNEGQPTLPNKIFTGDMVRLLQQRLEGLLPEHRALLGLAAVAGRQLDPALLRYLAPGIDLEIWLYLGQESAIFEVQDNVWQFTHEKLREVVLQELGDTAPLHQQIAEAMETLYDPDEYAEVLMQHWREAGNSEKELHYILLVAEEMVEYSARYESARAILKRGMTLAEPSSKLLQLLGECDKQTGNYPQAIHYYQMSLAQVKEGNIPAQVDLLNEMASTEFWQSSYLMAEKQAMQALMLAKQIDYLKGVALSLDILGAVERRLEAFTEAEQYLKEALIIWQTIGNQRGKASSLNNLGLVLWRQGVYDEARTAIEESLGIYRAVNDRFGIASALHNHGLVTRAQGLYEEALADFHEALLIQNTIGDQFGTASSLSNLSAVAWHQKEYPESWQYIQEALTINRTIGNLHGIAINLLQLTLLQLQAEDPLAKDSLYESLSLSYQLRTTRYILSALTSMAWWQINQGDIQQAAEWLGFIFNHPKCVPQLKEEAQPIFEKVQAALPAELLEVAMDCGKEMTLETAMERAFKDLA